MSIAHEALRDAAICAGLLLALPLGYCAVVIIKAFFMEVGAKCFGTRN